MTDYKPGARVMHNGRRAIVKSRMMLGREAAYFVRYQNGRNPGTVVGPVAVAALSADVTPDSGAKTWDATDLKSKRAKCKKGAAT